MPSARHYLADCGAKVAFLGSRVRGAVMGAMRGTSFPQPLMEREGKEGNKKVEVHRENKNVRDILATLPRPAP